MLDTYLRHPASGVRESADIRDIVFLIPRTPGSKLDYWLGAMELANEINQIKEARSVRRPPTNIEHLAGQR